MNRTWQRSRQFFGALLAVIEPADREMIEQFLNQAEKRLFYDLHPAIQKHCLNTAKTLAAIIQDRTGLDYRLLMKAALLHDLGKSRGNFTTLDRVWWVVVRRISRRLAARLAEPGSGTRLTKLRNAFYIHLNHEEIGAAMAEKAGLSKQLVYLIRNHHNRDLASRSAELALLRQADELN